MDEEEFLGEAAVDLGFAAEEATEQLTQHKTAIEENAAAAERAAETYHVSGNRISAQLTRAFDRLIHDGDKFNDVVARLGRSMSEAVFRESIEPVTDRLGGGLASVLNGVLGFGQPASRARVAAPAATALAEAPAEPITRARRAPPGAPAETGLASQMSRLDAVSGSAQPGPSAIGEGGAHPAAPVPPFERGRAVGGLPQPVSTPTQPEFAPTRPDFAPTQPEFAPTPARPSLAPQDKAVARAVSSFAELPQDTPAAQSSPQGPGSDAVAQPPAQPSAKPPAPQAQVLPQMVTAFADAAREEDRPIPAPLPEPASAALPKAVAAFAEVPEELRQITTALDRPREADALPQRVQGFADLPEAVRASEAAPPPSFAQTNLTPFAPGGPVAAPVERPFRANLDDTASARAAARAAPPPFEAQSPARPVAPVSVVMNISTPDADSFRRSQSQIAAQMGRMLARGQRNR